jgi:energy-converting hydrogenase Eha subunit A
MCVAYDVTFHKLAMDPHISLERLSLLVGMPITQLGFTVVFRRFLGTDCIIHAAIGGE